MLKLFDHLFRRLRLFVKNAVSLGERTRDLWTSWDRFSGCFEVYNCQHIQTVKNDLKNTCFFFDFWPICNDWAKVTVLWSQSISGNSLDLGYCSPQSVIRLKYYRNTTEIYFVKAATPLDCSNSTQKRIVTDTTNIPKQSIHKSFSACIFAPSGEYKTLSRTSNYFGFRSYML